MEEKKKKPIYKRWWFIVIVVILVLNVLGGIQQDEGKSKNYAPSNSTSNSQQQSPEPVDPFPNATTGEKNALDKAYSYLNYTYFSYTGLIDQLEFEKYSAKEAAFAADNCGADWNEQAVGKAKRYLETSNFSYTGLIDQLEFEGLRQSRPPTELIAAAPTGMSRQRVRPRVT